MFLINCHSPSRLLLARSEGILYFRWGFLSTDQELFLGVVDLFCPLLVTSLCPSILGSAFAGLSFLLGPRLPLTFQF
jgi:hypothetical protein